ncbi:MAG: sigma-70 family RNA polymerase sigma factor [Clostridia bacterium]|nr:sigma-70 family RNA polymerase sigma factor [Clostridia bacterium]
MEKDRRQISDVGIEDLFRARDEQAIAITEKKYGRYLFVTALNITGSEEDAKECVNDALNLLWAHIPPDRPENFKAYITRIVRNIALNRVAGKSGKKRVPEELVSPIDDLIDYLQDPSDVEKEFDDRLLKDCLNGFISSLGKRRRFIFVCRYFCFDSVPNIAKLLNISERTVFSELAGIRRDLKDKLKKEGFIS